MKRRGFFGAIAAAVGAVAALPLARAAGVSATPLVPYWNTITIDLMPKAKACATQASLSQISPGFGASLPNDAYVKWSQDLYNAAMSQLVSAVSDVACISDAAPFPAINFEGLDDPAQSTSA
jgi:hypothetical protein